MKNVNLFSRDVFKSGLYDMPRQRLIVFAYDYMLSSKLNQPFTIYSNGKYLD